MEKEKICFKSDGTKEAGAKIIKALGELGSNNKGQYTGDALDAYYYACKENNEIVYKNSMPEGYTLKDIHTWKQELSKFNIGDIINTNTNGYQYCDMDKLHKEPAYTLEMIKCADVRTKTRSNITVEDKVYSNYTKSWWYKVSNYSNWISEDSMSLSRIKEKPSKDKPFYVIVTEENKEVLSKWRGFNMLAGNIVGLCGTDLKREWNPITNTSGFGNEITFEQFLELYPECKEETTPENIVPEYVECIGAYGDAKVGQILDTKDEKIARELFSLSWETVLTQFNYLGRNFIASTKEAYEAKQGVKVIEEKVDVLVQTSMSQADACKTCKYHGKCHIAPHNAKGCCPAKGGKHYPNNKAEVKEEQWAPPPKYKAGGSNWIKPDWQIESEQRMLENARRARADKHAGFSFTPEMFRYPLFDTECFKKEENILPFLKIKKKKLLLSSVPEVISVNSKLITTNKKVKL